MSYRCVSMTNTAEMSKNSSAKTIEIGWRSTPNLKFNLTSYIRKPESSAHHSNGFLDGSLCVSKPNIPVRSNLAGKTAAEIRWRSTPSLKFQQVTSDVRKPENPRRRRPRHSFWRQTKKFVQAVILLFY